MSSVFDDRLISVGIQFNDTILTYSQDFYIAASGRKYTTAIMNECNITISNLTKEHRQQILTQASPIKKNLTPITLTLDVGRVSTGLFRLFEGNVVASGTGQPPDIGISLHALTNSYFLAYVAGYSQAPITLLSQIAQSIATDNGLTLVFQATDKQIDNYSFTGATAKQIENLGQIGNVNAFVDNDKLIILDSGQPLKGLVRLVNANTGMRGIPEFTQSGLRIKMMVDNSIQLFGQIQVESAVNPAANGTYYITQINFEIASREEPFWYILECTSPAYFLGGTQ